MGYALDAGLTAFEGYIDSEEEDHDIYEEEGEGEYIHEEEHTVGETVGCIEDFGGFRVLKSFTGGPGFAVGYEFACIVYGTETEKNHFIL